jgi:ABC-2 type transport system permease protein
MIQSIRRQASVYAALAGMVPKLFLAYRLWLWMEFFVQILSLTIFVFFWRAVYASSATLGGLNLQQTLNYIILAQILVPIIQTRAIFQFGFIIREGQIAVELLRPVDLQGRYYVESLTNLALTLLLKVPLLVLGVAVYGLQLPSDPAVWAAFALSLLLGHAILFCFDWIFACLAFYSTETWGLSVVREALAAFFSGALLPLNMMPAWLQSLTLALPFAQALYVPLAFLSQITPLSDAPRVWLVQLAWLAALLVLSRWVFRVAVRTVTVQGG